MVLSRTALRADGGSKRKEVACRSLDAIKSPIRSTAGCHTDGTKKMHSIQTICQQDALATIHHTRTGCHSYMKTCVLFSLSLCLILWKCLKSQSMSCRKARDQSRSLCDQLPCWSACLAQKKPEMATLATSTHYAATYLR